MSGFWRLNRYYTVLASVSVLSGDLIQILNDINATLHGGFYKKLAVCKSLTFYYFLL